MSKRLFKIRQTGNAQLFLFPNARHSKRGSQRASQTAGWLAKEPRHNVWKQGWPLTSLLVGLLSLVLLLWVGLLGAYQLTVVLPEETYLASQQGIWQDWNVRQMNFQTEQEFMLAEQRLQRYQRQDLYQNNPIPAYLLASLYEATDRLDDAEQNYLQVIALSQQSVLNQVLYHPYAADAHASLTLIYARQQRTESALAHWRQLKDNHIQERPQSLLLSAVGRVLQEPERADYQFQLGSEYYHSLQFAEARQAFQQAVSLSHDPVLKQQAQDYLSYRMPANESQVTPLVRYWTLAGASQALDENYELAIPLLQQAIKAAPQFEWPYHYLALVYHYRQQEPQALAYAHQAAHANPNYLFPYLTLGDVEMGRANYFKAIRHFEKALKVSAHWLGESAEDERMLANLRNQLGFAYEQIGRQVQAAEQYRLALQTARQQTDDYRYAEMAVARLEKRIAQKRG
ncbi:MAG: hypothetical protein SFZ03_06130 [Candidatus Melainabacteria bacterium]|nr:hypothetical protein [Candidatus Melainabacteria bacterium]